VLAVAVVAVGSYFMLSGGKAPAHPGTAASTRPVVTPSTPAAPPGPWKFIQSRADDPQPLTLPQLFPARFTAAGDSATLTIDRAGTNCSHAVLGATLEVAVVKAHCKQVMRATYLSTNGQTMATIGVLNLVNVAAAERVGKTTGAAEFIDPLPGAHGPTHNIKKGTGIEEAEVKGHYLILIWAEFSNLHRPSTAAKRRQLEQFAANLISGTANVSLTSRMVTGKPH
jgi:hypothetical protein